MRSVLIYVPDKARAVGGPLRVGLWRRRFWAPAVARAGLPHWFARSRQGERCKWCSQTEESLTHERRFGVHGLRHTAVALWIAAGASPKEVAARAGHTSVVTVLDRYGHLYEDSDERLTERLDAVRVAAGTGRTRDGHGSTALARLPAVNGNPA